VGRNGTHKNREKIQREWDIKNETKNKNILYEIERNNKQNTNNLLQCIYRSSFNCNNNIYNRL